MWFVSVFDLPVKSTSIPQIYSRKQQHFHTQKHIWGGGSDVTCLGSKMGNKINSLNKKGFFI